MESTQQKMPQPTDSRKRKIRGDTRFPGICRHARQLGVNRCTLYRVLTNEWDLPKLKARYDALLVSEKTAA